MKYCFYGLGMALILNLAVAGQAESKSEPRPAGDGQQIADIKGSKQRSTSQKPGGSGLTAASNVQAQLESTLDVRKAKVGDEVSLTTTKSVKQDGHVVIPKGSRLVGRVTEVSQRAKDGSASRLGLVFDRVEGKDLSTPVTASIVSIASVAAASAAGPFDTDISGSSQSSGTVRSQGSGGGLLGGVGSTVGGVVNTATSTVGNVAGAATRTAANTAGGIGSTLNGIQISNSASGSASGGTMLTSPGQNIRLEKGVTFNVNVAARQQ